ncbi:hypothetical protein K458DRAFT_437652 [Lentithecium fluviatile CBS 122367]|uniref:Protein kinase domain-containing protein n=1 Tax=Lentithecium fluviatile CBS 122367 TaxID=1168545 RepID=A0A6G1IDA4_9PLEO|nr:hypothetical protein K458DRAFT_437652 [Lentithecium fluviatile CBS 122367]
MTRSTVPSPGYIDMDDPLNEFQWPPTFAAYGTVTDNLVPVRSATQPAIAPRPKGSFATFVCHVVSLEKKLQAASPIVLGDSSVVNETGKILGQGAAFMVRHAQWVKDPNEPPLDVALKEIIVDARLSSPSSSNARNRRRIDWKGILFELRALLHEPIRYHPNLIRLLGIRWGLSLVSESVYPVLIMEYGSLGTFSILQASSEPLSFPIKQKLCYDVGRALSALHACGIVHGDIKHENVLIVPSKKAIDGIPYTAKLADFDGTVMDMTPTETRRLDTGTWPHQAPEVTNCELLTRSGMMLTDVYSFGLMLWRAFMDGEGYMTLPGATWDDPDHDRLRLNAKKASGNFTNAAITDINTYATERGILPVCVDVFAYAILHSLRVNPEDRDLTKAQAALRGINPGHIPSFLNFVRERNNRWNASQAQEPPGKHGLTPDSLSLFLGHNGADVDRQDNMPGYRPQLDFPDPEDSSFEPEKLKKILTWDQQRQMLEEMKDAARATDRSSDSVLEMKKTVAAFYVFQCYLLEFGAVFDRNEAVEWLKMAAEDNNSHEDADYWSQAWIWRFASALRVHFSIDSDKLQARLQLSVFRGHQTCLQDLLELAENSNYSSQKELWLNTHKEARHLLLSVTGAVGIGYFFWRFLTPPWDEVSLNDIPQLDKAIRAVLGADYDSCLKDHAFQRSKSSTQPGRDKERTAFDRIYINSRGHGPLHYAAASGAVGALRHMITKYECDINLENQHAEEAPIVCAAAGGKLDCVLLLLENGADPNGHRHGQEGPLHWLCSFLPSEMETIGARLVAAGADVELRCGGMRHDVRGIKADWEHKFEIDTTPLGRAVLMNNLDAVKVLLKLGADPLAKSANTHRGEWDSRNYMSRVVDASSPFELAAVLTLTDILAAFIMHIDGPGGRPKLKLIDELAMLDLTHEKKVTKFDPLTLQSRIVRGGVNYKRNLQATLGMLYARGVALNGDRPSDDKQKERSRALCKEVALGNFDVVEWLLQLGYNANGTQEFRPLQHAIQTNHEAMFNLLRRYKADVTVTQMMPFGSVSMLHVCASRPRQARTGRAIVDSLIAAGVPLESNDPRSKPPLATAILKHNFDVAAALIENGANVNATYPIQLQGPHGTEATKTVSVLVELLSKHTMHCLESLEFLFKKSSKGSGLRPDFLIEPDNKFSILHFLAASPQYTEIAQITPRILDLCLDTYKEPEFIDFKHPILGTPLYYAASNGHKAMVERLLDHRADATYNAGPDFDSSVQTILRPRETWTPLWAAILRLDDELRRGTLLPPAGKSSAWLSSNMIRNLESTVELLLECDDDATARQAFQQLQQRRSSLVTEARVQKLELANKRRTKKASADDRPISLGALSGSSEAAEKRIQEICQGPKEEWRTKELEEFLGALKL